MISTAVIMSALELGCIYALVALALFLSFRILNIADMTTDGAFTLGCAVSATIAVAGHPLLALPAAMAAGACAGFITAFLQTKLKIPSILAGIITNTGLYTVNLAVMGFSSNVNMVKADTMFSLVKPYLGSFYKLIPAAVLTVAVGILLTLFLKTRLGLSIRATGDNPDMVRASSINTAFTVTVGLCIANALTASILYRFIIAIALRFDLPSECLKLISAVIVALAIGLPAIKSAVRPATKGGKA